MKFQKYVLSVAAALTACGVSIGLIEIGRYLTTNSAPEVKEEIRTVTIDELRYPQPVIAPQVADNAPESETQDFITPLFSPDGEYFIMGDKLPKGFEDFERFEIQTADYSKATEENNWAYYDIAPEGAVVTNKEFHYKKIYVSEERLSFETETIKGISYKFAGEFVSQEEVDKGENAFIKGTLTKLKDGKKIAEAKVSFEMGGC